MGWFYVTGAPEISKQIDKVTLNTGCTVMEFHAYGWNIKEDTGNLNASWKRILCQPFSYLRININAICNVKMILVCSQRRLSRQIIWLLSSCAWPYFVAFFATFQLASPLCWAFIVPNTVCIWFCGVFQNVLMCLVVKGIFLYKIMLMWEIFLLREIHRKLTY